MLNIKDELRFDTLDTNLYTEVSYLYSVQKRVTRHPLVNPMNVKNV